MGGISCGRALSGGPRHEQPRTRSEQLRAGSGGEVARLVCGEKDAVPLWQQPSPAEATRGGALLSLKPRHRPVSKLMTRPS